MRNAVLQLAYEVPRVTKEKIDLIDTVMRQAQLLAINARIEAGRTGFPVRRGSTFPAQIGSAGR